MIQDLLTYLIITWASFTALYNTIKMFIPARAGKVKHNCSSCQGCNLQNNIRSPGM